MKARVDARQHGIKLAIEHLHHLGHSLLVVLAHLLRKKKAPREQAAQTLDEKVDVKLTRALAGVYANTDVAARFVMDEIRGMAQGALA